MADRIDMLLETVNRIEDKVTAQNGRIGKLERWRAYIIGIAIGASGLTTGAILKLFGS